MFKLRDSCGITGFGLICVGISLIGLLFASLDQYSAWRCDNYGEMTGMKVKYIYFDTCYIKVNDKWVRYDSTVRKNFNGEIGE